MTLQELSQEKMLCDIKHIANIFGIEKQSQQAMEELAELIQALSKYNRGKENALENVIEEIADVEIMLEQLKFLLNISEEQIKEVQERKIERTNLIISEIININRQEPKTVQEFKQQILDQGIGLKRLDF